MKENQIKITHNLYQIVAYNTDPSKIIDGHYGKRYVQFNPQSYTTKNPILVTEIGYTAWDVVFFESEAQAKKFLEKFSETRQNYTYEIKKYHGQYGKPNRDYTYYAEKVDSIYGVCYRNIGLKNN